MPPSKLENISGMVESANGLTAKPKSIPESAIPPHCPDSSTVTMYSVIPSSAAINDTRVGIPIPKFTKTGAFFSSSTLMSSNRILLAIMRS
jgi:hypothetical protein